MYVRWKKRELRKQVFTGKYRWKVVGGQRRVVAVRRSEPTGDYALSAQLVESRRVDGKPRQKVIKYLGTINESKITYVGHRIGFWRTASAAFKALNLPPEQQHAIELALHDRVPFPTKDEIEAERAHFAQLEANLKQALRSA